MTGAIILAAGKGERIGNIDKAFITLVDKPMIAYSLLACESCTDIDYIVVVTRPERFDTVAAIAKDFNITKLSSVVAGGNRRQDSVLSGISALPSQTQFVAIHDAARPLVKPELFSLCLASARKNGTGIAAHKIYDTVKECNDDCIVLKTLNREKLRTTATPQAFSLPLLIKALTYANDNDITVTDDAAAVELLSEPIQLIEWNDNNMKVTIKEDALFVSYLLKYFKGNC